MSHVSSSTHGNSSESLPRPLKLTAFSRLPRFKEGCRYETQRTPFWQAWQNLCATLSVCLCVSEVLMTVLRGPSQHQLCFHSLVEHSQPMDAHRLMSSEPQFPPTPTCIISASLQDIQERLYTLCICTRPVCLQIVRVLSELVRLSACVRLCMHQCTCRLVSVCGSS